VQEPDQPETFLAAHHRGGVDTMLDPGYRNWGSKLT
jgi:hypothetical protein